MRSRYLGFMASGILALLLAVAGNVAQAAPDPLPPNSKAFGKGYAQLTTDWVDWVVSIPAASNPLFDDNGVFAAVGQPRKVWFLVGNTTGGSTTRAVQVPAGTALFFPIVNYFWVNTPEYGDESWSPEQEALARSVLAAAIDTAHDLILEIDGRAVAGLDSLRVSGPVGMCTFPDDNIFQVPLDPVPHECLADGYWALLPPLSAGNHTIRFAGKLGDVGSESFQLDVTYHILVRGR